MSLFVFNPFRASEELTPYQLRKPIYIAWLRVLLRPLKWFTDLFLDKYCGGSDYLDYNGATAYVKYDRVIWEDDGVYELRVTTSTGVKPTGEALSATNWLKVLDNFIGLDERIRYNGQLIVFEYAINRKFKITAPPYIYFLQTTPGAATGDMDVYVPIAVWTALGPNGTARDNRIKEFVNKYALAGRGLLVVTY